MKVLRNLLPCTFTQHTYRCADEDMLHENERVNKVRVEKREAKAMFRMVSKGGLFMGAGHTG